MQSVLGKHQLSHANLPFERKINRMAPKTVPNDERVCWNTFVVPKKLTAFRQNAGRPVRELYVRGYYTSKKLHLAGAHGMEDMKASIPKKGEAATVFSYRCRTAQFSKDSRVALDEDGSKDKEILKSSVPRLFGKLKVQNIRTLPTQGFKHDMSSPGRSREIRQDIENLHITQHGRETFPPVGKAKSLKFEGKKTVFSEKSKHDIDIPGRRREAIPENEILYQRRGKSKNDAPKPEVSSLKAKREATKFSASSEAIPEVENLYGRRGDYMYHLQRGKVKPVNVSREEGFEFGGAADFFSLRTFKDIGSNEDMLEVLEAQQIHRPSHIQAMAYKHVIDGETCIIAEQSGSGKTLAYLAPLVQRLREEELQHKSTSFAKKPRALVLVPTAELAAQVLNTCRAISKSGVPFRSMVATGGFKWKTQLENLEQCPDILIVTPGRLRLLLQEGQLQLSNLTSIVLDEVDILFDDEDFSLGLENILNSAPLAAQYLFVTATLPLDVHNKLLEKFPDCKAIMGPGLHRTSSGLEEILIDCSGECEEKSPETAFSNKKSALLQLVEQCAVQKTVIFCNKIETCRKVENVLKRFDRQGNRIHVLPFHAAVSQESRKSNMQQFLAPQSKQPLFLICTDRASRGLELINVEHVVLFDFPRDPSEYVRRVGRTARGAGGKGKAFVFVVGKQVSLARRIVDRNGKGHPLHAVPSVL